MAGQKCTIEIDGSKLKAAILERGLSVKEAGERCGYSISGLQNAVDRRKITVSMSNLVDRILEIPLDLYKVSEKKPDDVTEAVDTKDSTYMTMRAACYSAISEYCENRLGDVITAAIERALS